VQELKIALGIIQIWFSYFAESGFISQNSWRDTWQQGHSPLIIATPNIIHDLRAT